MNSLGGAGLLRHREVHVDRLVRVGAGRAVEHGEQALRVHVEAHRAVGRRAGVRHVGEAALACAMLLSWFG